jgi:hypothetical protein
VVYCRFHASFAGAMAVYNDLYFQRQRRAKQAPPATPGVTVSLETPADLRNHEAL